MPGYWPKALSTAPSIKLIPAWSGLKKLPGHSLPLMPKPVASGRINFNCTWSSSLQSKESNLVKSFATMCVLLPTLLKVSFKNCSTV